LKKNGTSFCSIHTFGFGYELDSDLLNELSIEGNGSYSFIPDCSLVGTVFVNTLSNLLTTTANNLKLTIEPVNGTIITEYFGGSSSCIINDKATTLSLGSIHFDQHRDFIFNAKIAEHENLDCKIEYVNIKLEYIVPSSGQNKIIECIGNERIQINESYELTKIRLGLVDYLRQIIQLAKSNQFSEAQQLISDYVNTVKKSKFSDHQFAIDVLQDLEGQITEAVSKTEWFLKWGCHYLPSLSNAHLGQKCNNFKDPGVQHYGGPLFSQIRDNLDEMFVKLPPPRPTGFAAQLLQHQQREQAQINMRDYHYQGGG